MDSFVNGFNNFTISEHQSFEISDSDSSTLLNNLNLTTSNEFESSLLSSNPLNISDDAKNSITYNNFNKSLHSNNLELNISITNRAIKSKSEEFKSFNSYYNLYNCNSSKPSLNSNSTSSKYSRFSKNSKDVIIEKDRRIRELELKIKKYELKNSFKHVYESPLISLNQKTIQQDNPVLVIKSSKLIINSSSKCLSKQPNKYNKVDAYKYNQHRQSNCNTNNIIEKRPRSYSMKEQNREMFKLKNQTRVTTSRYSLMDTATETNNGPFSTSEDEEKLKYKRLKKIKKRSNKDRFDDIEREERGCEINFGLIKWCISLGVSAVLFIFGAFVV